MDDLRIGGNFAKLDNDRRLAFGWAYVAEDAGVPVADHSGDFIDKRALPALEDAVYEYMLVSREADEMHVRLADVGKVVESVVFTPEKLSAMGLEGTRTGWWVGFKVSDPEVWSKVKDGTYRAFSIRGVGAYEEVES